MVYCSNFGYKLHLFIWIIFYKFGIKYNFRQNIVYCSNFGHKTTLLGKVVVYLFFILIFWIMCASLRIHFCSLPRAFLLGLPFSRLLHCILVSSAPCIVLSMPLLSTTTMLVMFILFYITIYLFTFVFPLIIFMSMLIYMFFIFVFVIIINSYWIWCKVIIFHEVIIF